MDMVAKISPLGRLVRKRIEISSASVLDDSGMLMVRYWVPSKLSVVATARATPAKLVSIKQTQITLKL